MSCHGLSEDSQGLHHMLTQTELRLKQLLWQWQHCFGQLCCLTQKVALMVPKTSVSKVQVWLDKSEIEFFKITIFFVGDFTYECISTFINVLWWYLSISLVELNNYTFKLTKSFSPHPLLCIYTVSMLHWAQWPISLGSTDELNID